MVNETNIPRGPEDVPLKNFVKEHWLMVTIVDIKSGQAIRSEKINYSDREARLWLGKVTYFATTNGYSVLTMSEVDHVEWSSRNL